MLLILLKLESQEKITPKIYLKTTIHEIIEEIVYFPMLNIFSLPVVP
jgi:hypothetical protein